jgi:hypothetical protein
MKLTKEKLLEQLELVLNKLENSAIRKNIEKYIDDNKLLIQFKDSLNRYIKSIDNIYLVKNEIDLNLLANSLKVFLDNTDTPSSISVYHIKIIDSINLIIKSVSKYNIKGFENRHDYFTDKMSANLDNKSDIKLIKLEKAEPSKEYKDSSKRQLSLVVYNYLFNNKSHRYLDEFVYKLKDNKGLHSMKVLHSLGLREKHKNMFTDYSIDDVISNIELEEYSEIKELLIFAKEAEFNNLTLDNYSLENIIKKGSVKIETHTRKENVFTFESASINEIINKLKFLDKLHEELFINIINANEVPDFDSSNLEKHINFLLDEFSRKNKFGESFFINQVDMFDRNNITFENIRKSSSYNIEEVNILEKQLAIKYEELKNVFIDFIEENEIKISNSNKSYIGLDSEYYIKKKSEVKPSLGVDGLSNIIAEILKKDFNDSGMMFGIFGKWGRGKTYLFQKIKDKLDTNYITVEFSAWKYQETKESWAYLYENLLEEYLIDGLDKDMKKHKWYSKPKKIFDLNLEKYGKINIVIFLSIFISYLIFSFCIDKTELLKFISSTIGFLVVLKFFFVYLKFKDSAINMYSKYFSKKSFNDVLGLQAEVQKELKVLLKCWLKDSNKKIVLFVDDLDRCDNSQVLKVLDGLRIILDEREIYEKLIIITAIDENIIKYAISKKYTYEKEINVDFYQDYIEKVFLTGIKLNTLKDKESKEYLETLFKEDTNKVNSNKNEENRKKIDLNENDEQRNEDKETIDLSKNIESKEDSKETIYSNINRELSKNLDFDKDEKEYLLDNISKLKHATPRRIRIFYFKYILFRQLLQLRLIEVNKHKLWEALENHNIIIDILLETEISVDIDESLKKEIFYVKDMVSIL